MPIHNTFSPCLFIEQQPDGSGSSVDPVRLIRSMDTATALDWINLLFRPDMPIGDWPHALMSLDADKLRQFLDGATNAADQGRLTREQCKALFSGPRSPATAPDLPALALFERATEGSAEGVARLTRFLESVQYAAAHYVLRADELQPLMGLGCEGSPVALAWDKQPAMCAAETKEALDAWAAGCSRLCISGPLSVADTVALMVPDRRFIDDRERFMSDSWHMNLVFRAIGSILIQGGQDALPRDEHPRAQARMRQLLLAMMGTDGTTRTDMVLLPHATDAERQRSAQHLAAAMRGLAFKDQEVEAVTGVPRQRDGGQSRLPR